jgi:hypothetical protein
MPVLVRVRRKDGSSYLARVVRQNPRRHPDNLLESLGTEDDDPWKEVSHRSSGRQSSKGEAYLALALLVGLVGAGIYVGWKYPVNP